MPLRSIVITGGGSGIGRATAQILSDAGLDVLVVGRRQDALEEAISYNPEKISFCQADVSSEKDRQRILDAAKSLPKPLGLLHAAGIYQVGKLATLDLEDLGRSLETNATAKLALTQMFLEELSGGRLLFIGSDAATKVRVGAGAYSISQAASMMIIRALMSELKGTLDVSVIMPGLVETDMVSGFLKASEQDFPDVAFYQDLVDRGHIVSTSTLARFIKWVLLETNPEAYSTTMWDVRDEAYHSDWLEGPLYPKSNRS